LCLSGCCERDKAVVLWLLCDMVDTYNSTDGSVTLSLEELLKLEVEIVVR